MESYRKDWHKTSEKRKAHSSPHLILDWYHLMENLYKVGGSNQRIRQAKSYLWKGLVDDAIAVFNDLKKKRCDPAGVSPAWERAPRQQARNFQNYLRKHRLRIPDYQLDRELGICIGSGSALVLD